MASIHFNFREFLLKFISLFTWQSGADGNPVPPESEMTTSCFITGSTRRLLQRSHQNGWRLDK